MTEMNAKPSLNLMRLLGRTGLSRGALFGGMIFGALLMFEALNYTTTDYALADLLGDDLTFMGMRWATILSLAFCGIDFAGIARIFTPEKGADEPVEVWYLFGAWVLAAAMNAILTWWGVSLALNTHTSASSALMGRETLMQVVPVFVALMVWITRLLLIGTISIAGERIFSMQDDKPGQRPVTKPIARPALSQPVVRPAAPKPASANGNFSRPEPTYHPVGMSASPRDPKRQVRR
jgi:hypothetical protein